jgi:hypothetical protein
MECIKCGYNKRGPDPQFICNDCYQFSEIVDQLWDEVKDIFENVDIINPNTDKVLQFLSDSSFITHDNPQTRIYYKLASLLIDKAWNHENSIDEIELNRNISTTKNWGDVLKVFEDLNLIEVVHTKYKRTLNITETTIKVANALRKDSLDDEFKDRTALIFAGYVFMYLLHMVNEMEDLEDVYKFPYKRRPRTLWVSLMALWSKAYAGENSISEDELTKMLSRRGITGSTSIKIKQSLHHMTKDSTGLIKDVLVGDDGNKVYMYSDYVTMEFTRIRSGRIRSRGSSE